MGGVRCLDGEPPNLGESGVNAPVFNGIAFCYECHTSAGRIRRAREARARAAREPGLLVGGDLSSRGRGEANARKPKLKSRLSRARRRSLGLGMQWLDQLPFADNRVVQIGFLAACGIAALIVLAILYRLVFAHRLRVPGGRTRQPRLGLVDAFSLDGQRQLVLVRRDNVEHLVMIGGPNDVLVESQINRALTPARENNQASPLLAPSASGRRTDAPLAAAPVVAEAPLPSKVAAPAAAPAPAAPKAPAPVSAPAAPKAPAPAPAPAQSPRPLSPQRRPRRPQPSLRPQPPRRPRPNQSNLSRRRAPLPFHSRPRNRQSPFARSRRVRRRRRVPRRRVRQCLRRSFPRAAPPVGRP